MIMLAVLLRVLGSSVKGVSIHGGLDGYLGNENHIASTAYIVKRTGRLCCASYTYVA